MQSAWAAELSSPAERWRGARPGCCLHTQHHTHISGPCKLSANHILGLFSTALRGAELALLLVAAHGLPALFHWQVHSTIDTATWHQMRQPSMSPWHHSHDSLLPLMKSGKPVMCHVNKFCMQTRGGGVNIVKVVRHTVVIVVHCNGRRLNGWALRNGAVLIVVICTSEAHMISVSIWESSACAV